MVRASIYTIQGIAFFISHPSLWKKCFCGLLITMVFAVCSLIGFGLLVNPTAKFLIYHNCPNWLAFLSAICFMIIESAVSIIIFSLIFLPIVQEQIFNQVLKLKGYQDSLLSRPAPRMTMKILYGNILHTIIQILILLLTIPVNLIPVVGQITYCLINGFVYAWGHRLMDLMPYHGLSFCQTKDYAFRHYWSFFSFGSAAFALELIPIFNWFFIFTNVAGAALWAIDDYKAHFQQG